jgi:hypothetical protein
VKQRILSLVCATAFVLFANIASAQQSPPSPLATVNAFEFGADPTGRSDSYPALARAVAALRRTGGGTLYIPAGRYILESSLVINGSSLKVRGAGTAATTLTGASKLSAVVQEGEPSDPVLNNAIEDLTVTRETETGAIPENSVSIYWANFNYGFEFNTMAEKSYYARAWDCSNKPYLSIGYRAIHVFASNATRAYAHVANAADVFFEASEFGRNGGELYNPAYVIEVSENANDVSFSNAVLIPRGPSANAPTLLGFTHYVNSTGIFKFIGITSENTAYFVASDAQTPTITQMTIANSRIAVGRSFSNLDPDTRVRYASITGSNFGGGDLNLPNAIQTEITGGFIQSLSVSGAGETNNLTVTGAGLGNVHFAGTFGSLVFIGNSLGAGAIFTDDSVARTKVIQNRGEITAGTGYRGGFAVSDSQGSIGLKLYVDDSNSIWLATTDRDGKPRGIMETLSHSDAEPLHFHIPLTLPPYNITSLPSPRGTMQRAIIGVSGFSTDSVSPYAYSDGTNWRFLSNGAIVQ